LELQGGEGAMDAGGWAAAGDGFELPNMDFSDDFWLNSSINV
jgi:hypothetical protein